MQTLLNRIGRITAAAFMAFALAVIAQGAVAVAAPSHAPAASAAPAQV